MRWMLSCMDYCIDPIWNCPAFSDHRYIRHQKDFKQLGEKVAFLRGPCNTLGVYEMEGTFASIQQLVAEPARNTLPYGDLPY